MSAPQKADESSLKPLVARAVGGDADALSQLLEKYGPDVEERLQIARKWRPVLEPGDVMQVTYLEAFLQIGRFRPDQYESFPGWLRRIAENNLRDAIRGLERQKQPQPERRVEAMVGAESFVHLYETLAATSTTPSRVVGKADTKRLLEECIDQLPPDYARTIRLYDLEGRPIGEIAEQMGRSPGAVHMLRARAHERLCELLGTASGWFGSSA